MRVECWVRTSVPAHPKGCCCGVYKGTTSPHTPQGMLLWGLQRYYLSPHTPRDAAVSVTKVLPLPRDPVHAYAPLTCETVSGSGGRSGPGNFSLSRPTTHRVVGSIPRNTGSQSCLLNTFLTAVEHVRLHQLHLVSISVRMRTVLTHEHNHSRRFSF